MEQLTQRELKVPCAGGKKTASSWSSLMTGWRREIGRTFSRRFLSQNTAPVKISYWMRLLLHLAGTTSSSKMMAFHFSPGQVHMLTHCTVLLETETITLIATERMSETEMCFRRDWESWQIETNDRKFVFHTVCCTFGFATCPLKFACSRTAMHEQELKACIFISLYWVWFLLLGIRVTVLPSLIHLFI